MSASEPTEPDVAVATPIRIFDTTLRDGEQSPGCSMSAAQKLVMGRALDALGVDVIETGFPASSEADREATRLMARELRRPTLAVLSRCLPGDIETSLRALDGIAHPRLHVFVSTSPLHREHKLRMSKQQVLDLAVASVEHARKHVDDIEFSTEDGTRTERDFLAEVVGATIAAGATTINVPDTLGYATPDEIRSLFRFLIETVPGAREVVFSAHCHDDLGLAVANSLAAIEGGARQVECTINGIGERAGNCAMEELVMALKVRGAWYGADTAIDTRRLVATSQLLTRLTGMQVQRNKAVVGANAFAHESGIHQHGMLRHRGTYEIMRPEDVGWRDSKMVLGRHSGRAAVSHRLRALGHTLEDTELDRVFDAFKALCERQRVVEDADLALLMKDGSAHGDVAGDGYRLAAMTVSDRGGRASAQVELSGPDGRKVIESALGDGPVDALFGALSAATGLRFALESYQVHSVGLGADARGEANLSVRDGDAAHQGSGTSRDVIEASALAWLDVANRVRRAQAHAPAEALHATS